jgi:hypothetical protein
MPSLKKLKNTCASVYCATRSATTKEHLFEPGFFLEARRGYLSQVPACRPYNTAKADLEHYLTAVLPFGGRHADAPANLQGMEPGLQAKARGRDIADLDPRSGTAAAASWCGCRPLGPTST